MNATMKISFVLALFAIIMGVAHSQAAGGGGGMFGSPLGLMALFGGGDTMRRMWLMNSLFGGQGGGGINPMMIPFMWNM